MSPTKKDSAANDEIVPADPNATVFEQPPMLPPTPPQPYAPPLPQGSGKPGKVQTIAIMTLVSGIFNILWMISWSIGILVFGVSTLGLGCLLIFLVFPPLVLAVFEIIFAVKLLANPPKAVKPSQTLAILEIVCIVTGNLVSTVAGILALVFYSEPEVKAYFAEINSQI